jgi:hypothetical protein
MPQILDYKTPEEDDHPVNRRRVRARELTGIAAAATAYCGFFLAIARRISIPEKLAMILGCFCAGAMFVAPFCSVSAIIELLGTGPGSAARLIVYNVIVLIAIAVIFILMVPTM